MLMALHQITSEPFFVPFTLKGRSIGVYVSPLFLLIVSRCVADDDQAHNLAVTNAKVVRQDQVTSRQIGFVILAVVGATDDRVPIVVDNFTDVNGHLITNHLFLNPTPDRVNAPEFSVIVVHEGIVCKGRDNCVRVKSVHRRDVLGNNGVQVVRHEVLLLVIFSFSLALIHVERSEESIAYPVRGESRGDSWIDSPVRGECILLSMNDTRTHGEYLYL